jgi:hypothetical protein
MTHQATDGVAIPQVLRRLTMRKEPKNTTDARTTQDHALAPDRPVPLRRWSVADLVARAFAVAALEGNSSPALEGH